MLTYIIRRLLLVPVLLFGVTLVIFGMLQFLTPVERASLYIKQIPKNPGQIAGTIRRYHLDDPLPVQYWNWLVGIKDTDADGTPIVRGGVLRGNLGWSRVGSQAVVDVLKERFPATAELALWAFFPIIGVGVWLGIQAAINLQECFPSLDTHFQYLYLVYLP
jgi:peptide/nickel transport system permease protein